MRSNPIFLLFSNPFFCSPIWNAFIRKICTYDVWFQFTQSLTNERYVSILNHCFDDIERFIIRLQHAAAALRELQLRNNKRNGKGGHAGDGLLAIRARGPSEEEFFEILSKFKLAFNLLAKLKGKKDSN